MSTKMLLFVDRSKTIDLMVLSESCMRVDLSVKASWMPTCSTRMDSLDLSTSMETNTLAGGKRTIDTVMERGLTRMGL